LKEKKPSELGLLGNLKYYSYDEEKTYQ
jgi:hypothetical protein